MKTYKFQNRFGPGYYLVDAENEAAALRGLAEVLFRNGYPNVDTGEYYILDISDARQALSGGQGGESANR